MKFLLLKTRWEYSAHGPTSVPVLCACRHVLDDPSGRSSEDDGEGLQRGCCGEDDTVLDVCSSECRSVSRVSLKSLVIAARAERKTEHLVLLRLEKKSNQDENKSFSVGAEKQESSSQSRCDCRL